MFCYRFCIIYVTVFRFLNHHLAIFFLHQCYSCIYFAKKGYVIEQFLECDIKVTNTLYGLTFSLV